MEKYEELIVPPDMPMIDAMSIIDKSGCGIAFICRDRIMEATLTDGDIRRHILRKGKLEAPVSQVGNRKFRWVGPHAGRAEALALMKRPQLDAIPILDDGRIVGVHFARDAAGPPARKCLDAPVVIMAGGKGTRLYPYTKVLPKPLIPIGDLTITEHIMTRFSDWGCTDFTMIVNHKRNLIKAFFADSETNWKVRFVDEDEPLGTGGGLGLLRGALTETFFMTNCDILVSEDYSKIFSYHKERDNLLTMVCTTKQLEIPYGTVEIGKDGQINALTEKPSFSFLTNTGFYIIEPAFLELIPENTFVHITDLIQGCLERKQRVGVYPISEYHWSDMGQLDTMEEMRLKEGF